MQKRKALAAAGAATITALAATVAAGTNLGLFGLATGSSSGPGSFDPVGEAPAKAAVVATERTEVIDVPVPYYVSEGPAELTAAPPAAVPSAGGASGSSGGSGGGGGARASASSASSTTPPTAGHPEEHKVEVPEAQKPEEHKPEEHKTETPESKVPESHAPGSDD